jgi:hypothetical protein
MASFPSTENNNKSISFTKEASVVLEAIGKDILWTYEDYIIEDTDEFTTYHNWNLYIITAPGGVETRRIFYRELCEKRDKNQKCIKKTEMPEFKEGKFTEADMKFIQNVLYG